MLPAYESEPKATEWSTAAFEPGVAKDKVPWACAPFPNATELIPDAFALPPRATVSLCKAWAPFPKANEY